MASEREGQGREPDEIDEVVDEFGDRSGPDPAREPRHGPGPEEPIVEPAEDDEDE
jgi:hypothetical protein